MSKGFSLRGNAVRKANGAWTEFGILWASILSEVAYKGDGLVYVDRVNELAGEGANGKRIGSQRAKSLLDRLWSCGTFELEVRTDSKSANGKSRWAVPGENFDEDYWAAAERGLLGGTDHVESGRIGAAYDAGRALDLDGNLLHVFAAMHSRADLYGIYWGTLDETTVAVNKRTEIDPVTKKRIAAEPMARSTVHRCVGSLVASGTWSQLSQNGLCYVEMQQERGTVATPLWDSCDPPVGQLRPPCGTVATPQVGALAAYRSQTGERPGARDSLSPALTENDEATSGQGVIDQQDGGSATIEQDTSDKVTASSTDTGGQAPEDTDEDEGWTWTEIHEWALDSAEVGMTYEEAFRFWFGPRLSQKLAKDAPQWQDEGVALADILLAVGWVWSETDADLSPLEIHHRIRDTARNAWSMHHLIQREAEHIRAQEHPDEVLDEILAKRAAGSEALARRFDEASYLFGAVSGASESESYSVHNRPGLRVGGVLEASWDVLESASEKYLRELLGGRQIGARSIWEDFVAQLPEVDPAGLSPKIAAKAAARRAL